MRPLEGGETSMSWWGGRGAGDCVAPPAAREHQLKRLEAPRRANGATYRSLRNSRGHRSCSRRLVPQVMNVCAISHFASCPEPLDLLVEQPHERTRLMNS